jgi:hypothetical protein
VLPELALCHLKIRNSAENIRVGWLPKVAERERELHDLLPQRGEGDRPHQQMLERNYEITKRQADLVDAVERVRAELRTMRVNRDNFVAAAELFRRVAEKLKHLLVDRWMRGTELQAENDIGYVGGTLERAESHFKSIEASAAADQARYLQRINWALIVLGGLTLLTAVVTAFLAWKALPEPKSSGTQQAPQIEATPR